MTLFQIQSKFRDEKRPRFGLLRGREFIMKDAYSFHAGGIHTIKRIKICIKRIAVFLRELALMLDQVVADSGAIGGSHTHKIMA